MLVLLVAALAATVFVAARTTPGAEGHDRSGGVRDMGVTFAHAAYPFDVKDERKIVGVAENVFVGEVLEQVGSEGIVTRGRLTNGDPIETEQPRTQFSVRVKENVKGSLEGTVKVSQHGGHMEYAAADADHPEDGIKKGDRVRSLLLYDEVPLLEPGREYVFSTGYMPEEGFHEMVASGYGNVKIEDEKDRKEKVAKFKKAKDEQIDPAQGG